MLSKQSRRLTKDSFKISSFLKIVIENFALTLEFRTLGQMGSELQRSRVALILILSTLLEFTCVRQFHSHFEQSKRQHFLLCHPLGCVHSLFACFVKQFDRCWPLGESAIAIWLQFYLTFFGSSIAIIGFLTKWNSEWNCCAYKEWKLLWNQIKLSPSKLLLYYILTHSEYAL